ncbi:MAG: N-formylglutamate deformylase [Woeseia sp.]
MTDSYDYTAGKTPLLISIPHDGRLLPPAMAEGMTEQGHDLPDTDWHVRRLYEFSKKLGASIIAANYSRYVVDLNRSPTDEALYAGRFGTGLIPKQTFDGQDIYLPGNCLSDDIIKNRIDNYWCPYHQGIASSLHDMRERFGYALLWDAHSIRSRVPALFDGELPALNFGVNDGRSCASDIIESVFAEATTGEGLSVVLDGRFKGGYITRQYGDPQENVHAIQLELAQRCYMNEDSRSFDNDLASHTQEVLSRVLRACLSSSAAHYGKRE